MSSIELIQPSWPAPSNVGTVVTTRQGGVSIGCYSGLNLARHVADDGAAVDKNRQLLGKAVGKQLHWQWLDQVHGTEVHRIQRAVESLRGDGLVTSARGIVCCVLVADCLPILFCDEAGTEVAVVHGGWRGLAGGIIETTLNRLSSPPAKVMTWLGPAIGRRHFEVGAEVREQFLAVDNSGQMAVQFTAYGMNKFLADLPGIARVLLQRAGVKRIYGDRQCTFSDPEQFYSYRRDGITGRQLGAIYLRN